MRLIYTYGFILILVLFSSCLEFEKYSNIPEIHYKSFDLLQAIDSLGNPLYNGILKFSIIDGDGNIGTHYNGVAYRDTLSKYQYDLFLTRYNKIDGEYEEDTTKDYNTYVPYIYIDGQNKLLMGEIIVEIPFYLITYDTIQFEYFIVDREDNPSITEFTPDLPLVIYYPQ
ncbi:MAG: hypothetical protein JXB17_00295 [Bacteroidales bacterium]|nr:hypothetical protein [Bacteroidales bacterium]